MDRKPKVAKQNSGVDRLLFEQADNAIAKFGSDPVPIAQVDLIGWTGSPMRMVTRPLCTRPEPNGSTSRVPCKAMGTSGTPARIAM